RPGAAAGAARILSLAALHLSVSPRRAASYSLQHARGVDVRLRSGAALGEQFFSALLFHHRGRRRYPQHDFSAPPDGPEHRRFGGRLRHSSRLRADLPQPHHLFLFALSDQDEALRLDHRRHRALFLDDRRPERHRAPGASRGHGLRLRLSARLSRVQPVGARQRLSRPPPPRPPQAPLPDPHRRQGRQRADAALKRPYSFSQEIKTTPRITSSTAPILRAVSRSTSWRNSAESGRTKSDEPLISGEMIDTRSMLSAVKANA